LFFSCIKDPVDLTVFGADEDEEIDNIDEPENTQEEGTFTDENGNVFYTGLSCDHGSPGYGAGDNVLEDLEIPSDLPMTFDLSELLPPVDSQGSMGSCVSWAISYYMKSMQEHIETGILTRLSPAYTYNQISQGVCGGTALVETLEILKEKGVSSWSSFPYTDTDCTTQPDDAHHEDAVINKIADYKGLSGENMVNEIKTLITQQTPIIIAVSLSDQFGRIDDFGGAAYRPHIVDYAKTSCHAMLVVGYDNLQNAFKVVNSWGTDWGNGGFVWIDYKAFENVDTTAAFRVINAAYIAYDL